MPHFLPAAKRGRVDRQDSHSGYSNSISIKSYTVGIDLALACLTRGVACQYGGSNSSLINRPDFGNRKPETGNRRMRKTVLDAGFN